MKPHTTHFDDCGCLSASKDAEIAKLREALDEASIFATHIMKTTSNNGHWECARCALITIEEATK